MKVFISYHRADSAYRRKAENILKSHNIDYYVVPEDKNFNGQSAEKIKTYLCGRLYDVRSECHGCYSQTSDSARTEGKTLPVQYAHTHREEVLDWSWRSNPPGSYDRQ